MCSYFSSVTYKVLEDCENEFIEYTEKKLDKEQRSHILEVMSFRSNVGGNLCLCLELFILLSLISLLL